jgi:hypothetical protein
VRAPLLPILLSWLPYAIAMEDCCLVDLDHATDDFSELDGALLMEDLPPSDLAGNGGGDRLSHVIRSLEAEIIDEGEAAEAMVDDGRRLEDMLSDLEFTYWPEVAMEGHEVDGWYMYMDGHEGSIAGDETIDHQYYYVDHSAEQVYIPLWEWCTSPYGNV